MAKKSPTGSLPPAVLLAITPTFRPWTHTSDDSYIYQLSLVVATATVSFIFSAPPKEHAHLASSGRHGERGVQQHQRSLRTAWSLAVGVNIRLTNTRASCASACLSTASPCSRCFKARPSHHLLLWAASTPRRLMPSLSRNDNRRTKISGMLYFFPHLASPTTPLRSSRENDQKMETARRWSGAWTGGVEGSG